MHAKNSPAPRQRARTLRVSNKRLIVVRFLKRQPARSESYLGPGPAYTFETASRIYVSLA